MALLHGHILKNAISNAFEPLNQTERGPRGATMHRKVDVQSF